MKYTVLTYIINNYEFVHEIDEKDPEADYILVTDDENLKSDTWTIIYDPQLKSLSPLDACYSIRYNVFNYAKTDICIYLDSNIKIKKSLRRLIDIFEDKKYDMAMMPHPLNSEFVSEFKNWINWRKYPVKQAEKFFRLLASVNYPLDYKGLFQGCFKIVRNNKINKDFEQLTMAFMKYLGEDKEIERIDQTVYTLILNLWFNNLNILPLSEQILRSDWMCWYWHNSNKPNMNIFYDIEKSDVKWMFNKQVQCLYLL